MNRTTVGFGLALSAVLALTMQAAFGQTSPPPIEGRWGGDRLQLTLDANGGRIEMDCASGTIAGAVRPDARGAFSASGTFEQQRPGPQRADEPPTAAAAQFAGTVKDGVMTLTITPAQTASPQVYRLRQGETVKLVRCL